MTAPRLPSAPIWVQILGLTVGGLVAAQLVTLALTLLLPPEPPQQHSLTQIAEALKGGGLEDDGGPLIRTVEAVPPSLQSPGWVVSEGSTAELVRMLGAAPGEVRLLFYAPPPLAGAAPPPPPRYASLMMLYQPPGGPGGMGPRGSVGGGMGPGMGPGGMGAGGMGGPMRSGGVPGGIGPGGMGGAPSGGLRPGPRASGVPTAPLGGYPGGPPQGRRAPAGVQGPTAGTAAPARDGGGPISAGAAPLPAGPAGQGGPVFAPFNRGGASVDGTGVAPPLAAPAGVAAGPVAGPPAVARPAMAGPPGGGLLSPRLAPSSDLESAAFDPARSAAPPPRPRTAPPAAPAPPPPEPTTTLRPSETLAPPVQVVAPTVTAAARVSPQLRAAPALVAAAAAPALPRPATPERALPAPERATVFGLARAAYVEGEFVAALRRADGRWTTVRPQPEGFPNSWQKRVLLWFALAFLVVAPLGVLLARRLARPLNDFAAAAERLGRDPSADLAPLDGPAEVGRAASAFNLMHRRLKRYVEDRTGMIGAISHDLRTPLARMRFKLERAPPAVRASLDRDIRQMEEMIDSVLSFMRDETTAGRERVDLRSVLECVVDEADGKAELAPGAPVEVEIDLLAIQRVFENLVGNAVKYGAHAAVRLAADGGDAVVEIADDGPGLADDELAQVFKPFWRSDEAKASGKAGVGLGLAVSRSAVRAHGGELTLRRGSGGGLVAEVRVPLPRISTLAA